MEFTVGNWHTVSAMINILPSAAWPYIFEFLVNNLFVLRTSLSSVFAESGNSLPRLAQTVKIKAMYTCKLTQGIYKNAEQTQTIVIVNRKNGGINKYLQERNR